MRWHYLLPTYGLNELLTSTVCASEMNEGVFIRTMSTAPRSCYYLAIGAHLRAEALTTDRAIVNTFAEASLVS